MDKPAANNETPALVQSDVPVAPPQVPQPSSPQAMATPIANPTQPNKKVAVPEYGCCMASDPRADESVVKAIESRKD